MPHIRPMFTDWTATLQGGDAPSDLNRRLGAFHWEPRRAMWRLADEAAAARFAATLEERALAARDSVKLLPGLDPVAMQTRSYAWCCENVAAEVRRCLIDVEPPPPSVPLADAAALCFSFAVFYAAWAMVGSV